MRVRRDEDAGAVLVFVALSLVVLLGMVALTVDLGRVIAVRRDMVNAADAAALAGAQVCGQSGVGTFDAAQAAAIETAEANGATEEIVFTAPGCGQATDEPGVVTVRYAMDVEYFVAPILGLDGTEVAATATAIWETTGVANPVPFVAAVGTFQGDCDIPNVPVTNPPQRCYLWFDNDDFDGSTFGTLNLDAWNVSQDENCADKEMGANTHYAEVGGYDGPPLPPLNYPDPTWVCAATGNAQPMYTALAQAVGNIIALPVTDGCIRQGTHCEVFNVVGFTRLLLTGVFKTNEAPSDCGSPPTNSSSHCILVDWVGGGFGNVKGGVPGGFSRILLVE